MWASEWEGLIEWSCVNTMHTFHPYHVGFSNDCSIDLTLIAFKRPTKATLYIETQLFEWKNDLETSRFQSKQIELEYWEICRRWEEKLNFLMLNRLYFCVHLQMLLSNRYFKWFRLTFLISLNLNARIFMCFLPFIQTTSSLSLFRLDQSEWCENWDITIILFLCPSLSVNVMSGV